MGQAKLEVLLDRRSDSLWSWVVCVASFFLQFLVGGISNSFGSFFIALLSEYKRSEAETAWIGSLAVGLTYLCGPISTTLCHRLGCRIVACTGSLLFLIAAFLTSLVSNMTYMYLTFGILGGFAFSLMYFASLVVLIEYFNRHLSLANGIAVSGSGAGTLVISMIVDEMCRRYGLRAGFRFIAGMSLLGFVAGLSFAPLSKHPMESLIEKDDVKPKKGGFGKSIGSFLRPGKHWKNKAFVVWTLCLALVLFAYYIPYMYLVRVAKMNGVTSSKGALLVGILAICQALGKITLGKVADIPQVNRLQMEQISLLVIAVATCLFPLAKSYAAFLTYAIVQGFFDGGFSVLLGLVTHDIVGKQLMAGAVGSMFAVVAIPLTSGPPVAGLIYDLLGSYDAVYFLASAMVCAGSCLMFVIPWLVDTPNNGKRVMTGDQDDFFPSDGMDGGMSQVTEKKLAELLGKKTAADLLVARNRSLLDHSVGHSRPSSFVLFSIVSDENYRDLSTYTSRMDLNTETPSSPQGSTPGRRQRFFDMDHLRESTFSLYSSARMTLHGSSIQVHSLEPTIQEVAETRTNFHETSLPVLSEVANEASLPVINEVPSEVCVTNISEAIHNVPLPVVIEEPQDTPMLTEIEEVTSVGIEGAGCSLVIDDVERKRLSSTSWASAQSSDSLKSSSLESTATNDSGFEENELFVIDPSTDIIEVTKGLSASVAPFVENCDYRTYIANADANDYDDGITQDMNTAGLTCVFADEANRDILLTSSPCSDPSANSADSEKCLEAPSESQSETEYETDFYSLELENNLEHLEGISVSSMHSLDNLDSMPEVAWLGSRLTVETVV